MKRALSSTGDERHIIKIGLLSGSLPVVSELAVLRHPGGIRRGSTGPDLNRKSTENEKGRR